MIEFKTSIKYILDYLQEDKLKVLDVGVEQVNILYI